MGTQVAKWWLPDEIIFAQTIPVTAVGKIDKKALRESYLGKDSHVIPTSDN